MELYHWLYETCFESLTVAWINFSTNTEYVDEKLHQHSNKRFTRNEQPIQRLMNESVYTKRKSDDDSRLMLPCVPFFFNRDRSTFPPPLAWQFLPSPLEHRGLSASDTVWPRRWFAFRKIRTDLSRRGCVTDLRNYSATVHARGSRRLGSLESPRLRRFA